MAIKNRYLLFILVLVIAQQTALAQQFIPEQPPMVLSDSLPPLPSETDLALPIDTIIAPPDSIKRKPNAIDAPIYYASKDSMIMVLEDDHNMLYLYGESNVKYTNRELTGEYIEVDATNSIVYSTFGIDSIGNEFGFPIFKEGESQYEMRKANYNFKTKKMYITDVITQQGEGYVTAGETKMMPNDDLFMRDGKYTTCDDHDHPHFYLKMTKAKVRPGKNIVMGPAYLVVEDVPLPVAVPFGFFPFSKDYSSGIIMPTYGDEMRRGFSLRDGGYYFAINDYVDLALTGEYYTKGSWGINASSSYRKMYKYSGGVNAGYLVTITGEKGDNDYSKATDFKVNWQHSQDAKSNPFSTFSASVNFTTSSYDRNQLNSLYSDLYTQNTKASTINYTYRPPNSPFSFSLNTSINQISRDTTLSVTLPNLTITMRDVYPFKRKEQVGNPRWYENIRMSYSGLIMNSITAKEYDFFQKSIIKDWRNGMKHEIPISASFNLFKYITISPAVNYSERWYTSKINRYYDYTHGKIAPLDTVFGFNRVYNYSASVSAQTKLYGMYKFWRVFGKWTEKTQIRHVFTPNVSFSGAPDFSDEKYGFYKSLTYYDNQTRKKILYTYSPFDHQLWGVPGKGQTGNINFGIDNNLEMKVPVGATDSTRKISLIDNLHLSSAYNFLADSMNWSNINASVRLKFGKSFSLNLQGVFDVYTYNEEGQRINVPRWNGGKGIGRLMSTGTSFSYSLNNSVIKGWFNKEDKEDGKDKGNPPGMEGSDDDDDNPENSPDNSQPTSLRKKKEADANKDIDGYLLVDIPWNLSFNYSLSMGYDMRREVFNKTTREYPYRFNQSLGISGNISPTKGWSFNFSTNYDFDSKKFATMQCTLSRQMHCWSMSASIIPIGPYQSYNFSIAVNSSLLQDLKYNQSSNFRDAMNWGN